jgi:peptide/nickel transport system ATP-binding protein
VFLNPRHPYTAALLESIPDPHVGRGRMAAIPGLVPPAHAWPGGCRFHPRCAHAVDRCRHELPAAVPLPGSEDAMARCLRVDEVVLEGVR